ncbi:MAG: hypothetical protein K6B14_06645 [Lachnospiraceae bacterium]|nr:hypothetical protein [Lachnospiraceae bacterium]
MSELCTIKANSHGIQLLLDENADFEELVTEVCREFAASRSFFGSADIILEVVGREMSLEDLRVIVQAIELNSDVKVKLLADTDPDHEARALKDLEDYYDRQRKERVQFLHDDVAIGTTLSYNESVVIMGDIKDGASVASTGNVIIMGDLCGSVVAGGTSDTSCFVAVAGKVESTDVIIGGVSGHITIEEGKKGLFGKKEKNHDVSCFAVYGGRLTMEPMREGILTHVS